jgi:hypothetical protein
MNKTLLKGVFLISFLFATANVFAGADAHITRAKDWTQSKSNPISLSDWTALVKSDPEFHPGDSAGSKDSAVWTDPKDKSQWIFSFSEGEISVKNPSDRVLAKMKSVAAKLNAKVLDDDSEGV